MIVVPTNELSNQIAIEISALLAFSGSLNSRIDESVVHIQNITSKATLDDINQSIVIGTPQHLLSMVEHSSSGAIKMIKYIVLDEVDRLLEVLSKYATYEDRTASRENPNEANKLLAHLVSSRTQSKSLDELQVVAASATVGRPLRRELHKLFKGQGESYGADFPTLRTDAKLNAVQKSSNKDGRQVSIPPSINHLILLLNDEKASDGEGNLSNRMGIIEKLWKNEFKAMRRGILFVPSEDDAQRLIGMLKFWGWDEIRTYDDVCKGGNGGEGYNAGRELFVIASEASRGLHIADVECVMILSRATTMHEYLHMAGRTGRMGNKSKGGSVVSLVDYDDFKKIQAWQIPLGIQFKVRYQ